MKLEILWTGNGFETRLGNSSFLQRNADESKATLYDCGWSIFAELRKLEIEQNRDIISKIDTIYISHLHEDHAGSAGLLALYKKCIHGSGIKFVGMDTRPYLDLVINDSPDGTYEYEEFGDYEIIKNDHGSAMPCCSILKDGIYYSGNTKCSMLDTDAARKAKIIIHEARSKSSLLHTNINDLARAPADIRSKTYLIHYMAYELETLESQAKEFGFAGVLKRGMVLHI